GIQPLRVVDNTQERPPLGGLRQQAEDRQSDQEWVWSRPGAESEGDGERVALRRREALDQLEERRAELPQPPQGEPHPPLDSEGAGDPELSAGLGRIVQERGLADARLAVQHQRAAVSAARGLQQPFEHLALTLPAEQPLPRRPPNLR